MKLRYMLVATIAIGLSVPAHVAGQRYQGRQSQDPGNSGSSYYGQNTPYYGQSGSAPSGPGQRSPGTPPPGSSYSGRQGAGWGPIGGNSAWQPSPPPTNGMNASGYNRRGGGHSVAELAAEADRLASQHVAAKARGDMPGAATTNSRLQSTLSQLMSMEPQNPKWKYMRALTWKFQAGGPSRSGTAGDRQTLKQALTDLDAAAACPGSGEYAAKINALRGPINAELSKRIAKGKEIQRRGARQFAEIYNRPDVANSTCPNCGHYKSNVDRCATCGAF